MSRSLPPTTIRLCESWATVVAICLLYTSYDATHGLATAFFLFLFGEKVIRKVERAKIKYGMYR